MGNDIIKFNAYILQIIDKFATRGETTQDLLTDIFNSYVSCTDKPLVEYIQKNRNTTMNKK